MGPMAMEVWLMLNLDASSSWVLIMLFLLVVSLGTELRTTVRPPNTETGLSVPMKIMCWATSLEYWSSAQTRAMV